MIIPFNNALFRRTVTGLIVPHGMTDLIHAQQNYLTGALYRINGATMLTTYLLNKTNQNIIINTIFLLASTIHFRRDFPKIKNIPRLFLSGIFLLLSILYNPNLFIYYMVFIHLPNHYRMKWYYLSRTPIRTITTMTLSTGVFLIIGEKLPIFINNKLFMDSMKSIIISHIIYEECHVYDSLHKYFPKYYVDDLM